MAEKHLTIQDSLGPFQLLTIQVTLNSFQTTLLKYNNTGKQYWETDKRKTAFRDKSLPEGWKAENQENAQETEELHPEGWKHGEPTKVTESWKDNINKDTDEAVSEGWKDPDTSKTKYNPGDIRNFGFVGTKRKTDKKVNYEEYADKEEMTRKGRMNILRKKQGRSLTEDLLTRTWS